jgi:nickel/cobalt transporter (NiCoT) family protein
VLLELTGLAGLALVFGMRHALDVDHLATIDGLTRSRVAGPSRRAAGCGLWFSAGHGLAVMAMATALAVLGQQAAAPAWMASSGLYVAVGTLVTLGGVNLWAASRSAAGGGHAAISVRQWLARRLRRHLDSPLGVMGLGGLFAVSFDAFGTAALFAASATSLGLPWVATALAGVFAFGMATVDGLAGWGSAWLLRQSHALAPGSPRLSAMLLGLGCLATAAALVTEPLLTRNAGFSEPHALMLSAAVGLLVPMTYGITRWWLPKPVRLGSKPCNEHHSHD